MILNLRYYKKAYLIVLSLTVLFLNFIKEANASILIQETLPAQIQLSTFDIDVTPEVGQRLAFDPVVNTWDLGLRAKGMVIQGSGEPIVLLAIDWLGISFEAYDTFKNALASAAGTIPEKVAVHALHQHDAPEGKNNNENVLSVLNRLQDAVKQSLSKARPITHLGLGEAEVFQVASNRRILDPLSNTVRASRMSRCRDSLLRAEPEGIIDPDVCVCC